jgi:D-ribose pyranase
MKKTHLLNSMLPEMIASLGHQDMLVVADAGLPVPMETLRIDLALTRNIPRFMDTLQVILDEMQVERYILAEETSRISPDIQRSIQKLLDGVPAETVPHVQLKELTRQARAVVRTGEYTPYANIILVAGVVF